MHNLQAFRTSYFLSLHWPAIPVDSPIQHQGNAYVPDSPDQSKPRPKGPKQRLGKDITRVVVVAAVFVALALLLKQPYVRNELIDIQHLRNRFRGAGWQDELSFVAAAAIVNALGVPRLWISIVAGTLFGAVFGTFLALVASVIGASIDFYIGRYVLRGPIKRQLPPRLRRWYKLFNKNGFQGVLYIRLFPLANATISNLIGGASKISYGTFLAATIIGFIPLTIIFAVFGSSAAKQSGMQLVIGILLFALTVAANYWWRRGHSPPTELDDDLPSETMPANEEKL